MYFRPFLVLDPRVLLEKEWKLSVLKQIILENVVLRNYDNWPSYLTYSSTDNKLLHFGSNITQVKQFAY